MEIMPGAQPQKTICREAQLLLDCARTRITPATAERIRAATRENVDWFKLTRWSLRHGVLPLVHANLERIHPHGVPQGVLDPWRNRCEAEAAKGRFLSEELARIVQTLEKQEILAVPYKGPALSLRLYGSLKLRGFNDLDIVVHERDAARARRVIAELNYAPIRQLDNAEFAEYVRSNHEIQFCRDKACLDLHWRFTGRPVCVSGDPERFLQRLETISVAGTELRSLRPDVYLLLLSMHAAKHKWAQLKWICDIAEIVAIPDLDWEYVLRESTSLGFKRALATSLLLAEDLCGAEMPPGLVDGLKTDRAARALAAQIRAEVCEEPNETWGRSPDFTFQCEIRERFWDQANVLLHRQLRKIRPNDRDRRFLRLPRSLDYLYYLVKPVRVASEKLRGSRSEITDRRCART